MLLGPSVAHLNGKNFERARRVRDGDKFNRFPCGKRGAHGRKIIRTRRVGDQMCELHATKGWRCYALR